MSDALDAAGQAWAPFVLVAGLLLLGALVADDGVFAAAGGRLDRLATSDGGLLLSCLALVAVTTAVLNLDTAVVFLTPVVVLAARRRRADELPFLLGTLFMANASSLFLPGSNLTNLLVLGDAPGLQQGFAATMLPAAAAATLVTGGLTLAIAGWRSRTLARPSPGAAAPPASEPPLRGTIALAAAVLAAVAMVVMPDPALPVLAVALVAAAVRLLQRRTTPGRLWQAVNPAVLLGLFAACVALGTLARAWTGPAALLRTADAPLTAAIGTLASVAMNNLPAAVLLTSRPVAHPDALLVGLNVGPNLAVTGSLAAFLWLTAARSVGARPRLRDISRFGVVLAPAAIAAALLALSVL